MLFFPTDGKGTSQCSVTFLLFFLFLLLLSEGGE